MAQITLKRRSTGERLILFCQKEEHVYNMINHDNLVGIYKNVADHWESLLGRSFNPKGPRQIST